ncbi:MAG: hypothetical protein M1834_008314 [Cirrosporium novae-zelandiae]|nr:MAG: hypothetical protein M1834_008314 [Cirrosporium novae-zelandiae]
MAFPPPPGLKSAHSSSTSTPQPHPSLPARPPPPAGPPPSFKPAYSNAPSFSAGAPGTSNYNATSKGSGANYNAFTSFAPRSVASQSSYRTQSPVVSAPPAPPTGFSAPQTYQSQAYTAQPSYQQTNSYYGQDAAYQAQYSPPQIRNPFPPPSTNNYNGSRGSRPDAVDPEMEAQIAQWQSAYMSKDPTDPNNRASTNSSTNRRYNFNEGSASATGSNVGPLGTRPDISAPAMSSADLASAAHTDTGVANIVTDGKKKTVVRSGGGQTWTDTTLLEWDPAHFRLFVGNLAGEVTDDSLLKAFSKYSSVQKARVVRDKRTTKSKGYGFVSFSDGEEYFQAARDMQGKYIGSHPVLLRRSTTEIRPTVPGDKKKGKGSKGGGGGHGNGKQGGGIQKKQGKTRGGLRVLG